MGFAGQQALEPGIGFGIAPGIDLPRDMLDQMEFAPLVVANLGVMDRAYFQAGGD